MGIRLDQIQDPRLRAAVEKSMMSSQPLARPECTRLDGKPEAGEVPKERDLHDDIEAFCRSEGWYYIHSRMDQKTTVAVGAPDFVIFLPYGRLICLECKRKGNKPTLAQQAALAWLNRMQHNAAVVYDFATAKQAILVVAATGRLPCSMPASPEPRSNTAAESSA